MRAMQLGLDVGGTHTDAVLIDRDGIVASSKVVTNHDNLFNSIIAALQEVIRGQNGDRIEGVNLSTTLTTNAIIEGKGEKVGIFVSSGPGIDPQHHRIGDYYYCIDGSIDHRGMERRSIDEQCLAKAIEECRKAEIKIYGAVTKFSTRNPGHENFIKERVAPFADFVTLGHSLSGQLNFPRRISTAYYNSAVWRLHNEFVDALVKGLNGFGLKARINILKADGGTMPLAASRSMPVQSILSGPAASIMGIGALCSMTRDSVVLDIGGTSTDIAIFAEGTPLLEKRGIPLSSRLTLVRALKTKSIGIGGDSLLHISEGKIRVGPQRPGQSMAAGGHLPTLIDALNFEGVANFGKTHLSREGIAELSKRFHKDPGIVAEEAIDYAVRTIRESVLSMVKEIQESPVYTIHELLRGKQVSPQKIYVMGGPAKAFAGRLSGAFGLEVVVPPHFAIANAIGAALTRTTMDIDLHADTEKGSMFIPTLGVQKRITPAYSLKDAEEDARQNLLSHVRSGALKEEMSAEITEASSFNMVGGCHTTGKNIRVKCQIKPGYLTAYEGVLGKKC